MECNIKEMECTRLFKWYLVFILLVFINSMYPWFSTFRFIDIAVSFIGCILSVAIFFKNKLYFKQINIFFVAIAVILFVWDYHLCNIFGVLTGLLVFISWCPLLFFDDKQNERVLNFITTWLSRCLFVSIVGYVLYLLGVYPLSPSKINFLGTQYELFNYYLFVIPQNVNAYNEYIRFRSVFLEPGHMAMGVTILIFANKFNLKNKYVLILFIANLLSFSLAGYIVMTVGFVISNININGLKRLILGALLVIVSISLMTNLGYGKILDTYIFKRLEYSEATGTIKGNNRTRREYEQYYKSVKSNIDTFLFGDIDYAMQAKNISGAGIKKYVVEKGAVGILFVLLFYLFIFCKNRTIHSFVLSFTILLMLYQDAYPMWACVPISYITGNASFRQNKLFFVTKKDK